MEGFLVGLFIVLNLCVRVPLRIVMLFKKNNEALEKADFWATIITSVTMEAMMLYAYSVNEINLGIFILLSCLFFGFPLILVALAIKRKRDEMSFWEKEYRQTEQHPERDDYGLCRENPIWAGTAQYYFSHIYTKAGNPIRWNKTESIELEKKNGFPFLNGFYACELAKYEVYSQGELLDVFYVCTKGGLDKMNTWNAPRGYTFIKK